MDKLYGNQFNEYSRITVCWSAFYKVARDNMQTDEEQDDFRKGRSYVDDIATVTLSGKKIKILCYFNESEKTHDWIDWKGAVECDDGIQYSVGCDFLNAVKQIYTGATTMAKAVRQESANVCGGSGSKARLSCPPDQFADGMQCV